MKRTFIHSATLFAFCLMVPTIAWAGAIKELSELKFSISGHPINFKDRRSRFLNLASKGDDKPDWYCRNNGSKIQLAPTVRIDGESRISGFYASISTRYATMSTDPFMETLYNLIGSYVYGDDHAPAEHIYNGLLEGARTDAFSVIDPDASAEKGNYGVWDEPTYYASMILWPLGYAYVLLVDEYGENDAGVKEIKAWGDRLYLSSESKDVKWVGGSHLKGMDRAGLKAAAYSIWGNATGNEEALRKAYWYFRHALNSIGEGGKDIYWKNSETISKHKKTLKYVGMTLGPALYAAYALNLSGATDVFGEAPTGGNIKEGMAWLIKRAFETKDGITKKTTSHSDGMGYAELFIKLFPEHPAAKLADSRLKRSKGGIDTMHSGGGPATCLLRDIESPLWKFGSQLLKATSETLTNKHDGAYKVNISCVWKGWGKGTITQYWTTWSIKVGRLLEKTKPWDIQGQLIGEHILEIKGARQDKKGVYNDVDMRVEFGGNGLGKVSGSWKNGDCNGEFAKS